MDPVVGEEELAETNQTVDDSSAIAHFSTLFSNRLVFLPFPKGKHFI